MSRRNGAFWLALCIFLLFLVWLGDGDKARSQTFGTSRAGIFQPAGATPTTASAVGTTLATTATLAADTTRNTYICGFQIRSTATAASVGDATVTGVVGGTMHFTQYTQAAGTGMVETNALIAPCMPSSAVNTPIAVISAAPGAGGVVSVTVWGYQF